jgi:multidrug efflux pump subunit AcrA (membrane-fusion protein)
MKKIFVAALLLTAAFAWWFGDGPVLRNQLGIQQGKAAPAPAQYLTAAIEEGELRRVITAAGTLNAIVNVEVGSQLSGQVAELLVDFKTRSGRGSPSPASTRGASRRG